MILINKGETKKVYFTLSPTITPVYYLFQFTSNDTGNITYMMADNLSAVSSYSAFLFVEGSTYSTSGGFIANPGTYDYQIYETAYNGELNPASASGILEIGLMTVLGGDFCYTPEVDQDYVYYDECSGPSVYGITGATGPMGPTGPAGTSGTSGQNGTSGVNGTSGTSGLSGTSGTSGVSGSSGTSGIDGTSGTSGANGSSGTSGVNGTSGTSATSGTSGTRGTSGTSGVNGTSGTSGANGSSGTSGTRGTSGTSGINGANQRINTSTTTVGATGSSITSVGTTGKMIRTTNAFYITPVSTGDVYVTYNLGGSPYTLLTTYDAIIELRYGTGAIPANGSAATGTATNIQTYTYAGGSTYEDAISLGGVITGLTVNTQYWFALCVKGVGGTIDTFYFDLINASGFELAGAIGATGSNGTSGTSGLSGTSGTSGTTGTSGTSGLDGDKYATTTNTSLTIANNGTASLITNDLHLDYSIAQTIIIAYDLNNHMHAEVISYNGATGELVFNKTAKTGSGTYTSWSVNLDGAVGQAGTSGTSGVSGGGPSYSYYTEDVSLEAAKVQVNSTSNVSLTSLWRGATGSEYHQTYVLDGNTGAYGKLSMDTTLASLQAYNPDGTSSTVYVSGGTINAYTISGDTTLSSNVLIYQDAIDISSTDSVDTSGLLVTPTNVTLNGNDVRVAYLAGNVGDFVAIDTNGKLVATASSGGAGTSGTSGIDGTSGTSGVNGLNGSSGTSGVNGVTGTSGTSGVSGGGTAATTMFNNLIVPATASIYPFYKLNVPALTFGTSTFTMNSGVVYFSSTNFVAGDVINEIAIYCSSATSVAAATCSIGLYSTTVDNVGRLYANTLVQTLGTVTLTSVGRKTVTGINYTIPSSTNGIYYIGIVSNNTSANPVILGPINSSTVCYYASLDGTTMNRSVALSTNSTTLPTSITPAQFTGYTHQTSTFYIGFRS